MLIIVQACTPSALLQTPAEKQIADVYQASAKRSPSSTSSLGLKAFGEVGIQE